MTNGLAATAVPGALVDNQTKAKLHQISVPPCEDQIEALISNLLRRISQQKFDVKKIKEVYDLVPDLFSDDNVQIMINCLEAKKQTESGEQAGRTDSYTSTLEIIEDLETQAEGEGAISNGPKDSSEQALRPLSLLYLVLIQRHPSDAHEILGKILRAMSKDPNKKAQLDKL
jgi:hypothetical protein